jgi:hypothetical protein
VNHGQLAAFHEPMVAIKRLIKKDGWKLVAAWSAVIGDLHEVHDLSAVEDRGTVRATFATASGSSKSAPARWAARTDGGSLSLVTKALPNPRQAGGH